MILNTGSRTDIPAFYSDWFYERVRAGYVLVRNPYDPLHLTRYQLDPKVIDVLVFCTKDPGPMLDRLSRLSAFTMFWSVTITPYGKEVEPYVPPKEQVIGSFKRLSEAVGKERISWRYDPVLLTERYTIRHHIRQFEQMARALTGYTDQCVVSFIDLYEKTKRNFPGIRSVTGQEQEELIDAFSKTAKETGMQIHLCCEDPGLARKNVDADGCLSKAVLERALGCRLSVPKRKGPREGCDCLLGADIGAYDTCLHGCLYCYAVRDRERAVQNRRLHDPASPLLIGNVSEEDVIHPAEQMEWRDGQMELADFLANL